MKICLNCSKLCNDKWETLDWDGGQIFGVLQALGFAFTQWQIQEKIKNLVFSSEKYCIATTILLGNMRRVLP